MTISSNLTKAILSFDSYNRSYDAGITLNGDAVGNASITKISINGIVSNLDSALITDQGTNQRLDDDIGFYGIAYSYNGETIIAYRGTDDRDEPDAAQLDEDNGWGVGAGSVGVAQAGINARACRANFCVNAQSGSIRL